MALKLKEKQSYSKTLTSTLGATLLDDGCFFSVWSPLATSIVIHFYTFEEEPLGSVKLIERRGGFWHFVAMARRCVYNRYETEPLKGAILP